MTQSFEPVQCLHDGTEMEGFLARPQGDGPHPTVLMFPGATGSGPSFEAAVRELAARGYAAIGISVYERGADITTPQSSGAYFADLMARPEVLRARVLAWFNMVCALPFVDPARVAALGYCFGGKCVLELARSGAPVRAVSSFHGLLTTHAPSVAGVMSARVLVWTGGRDPYAPRADLDSLRAEFDAAGVDYSVMEFSRAQHAFTDPDHDGIAEGIAYDPMAHRIAWSGTIGLLEVTLAA